MPAPLTCREHIAAAIALLPRVDAAELPAVFAAARELLAACMRAAGSLPSAFACTTSRVRCDGRSS